MMMVRDESSLCLCYRDAGLLCPCCSFAVCVLITLCRETVPCHAVQRPCFLLFLTDHTVYQAA